MLKESVVILFFIILIALALSAQVPRTPADAFTSARGQSYGPSRPTASKKHVRFSDISVERMYKETAIPRQMAPPKLVKT